LNFLSNFERNDIKLSIFKALKIELLHSHIKLFLPNKSSIKDATVVRGGKGQGFCDNSTKASVIKIVTMRLGGSKNVQNFVTSFMDDPKARRG
jgi:hypothetical protein